MKLAFGILNLENFKSALLRSLDANVTNLRLEVLDADPHCLHASLPSACIRIHNCYLRVCEIRV